MPVDSKRLQSMFLAAFDAPDRAAVLDRECAGDAELRQRVEKLQRSATTAGSWCREAAIRRSKFGT